MKLGDCKGFTLIELILVVSLILALIALSVPLFKRTFSDLSAKEAAYSIAKLINYGQEMAVLERYNYKVVFNFEKSTYQLFRLGQGEKEAAYKRITSRFGRIFTLPNGVTLKGSKKESIFYPDGHCDAIAVSVLVKNEGYSVTAKRFGNMVQIKEINGEQ